MKKIKNSFLTILVSTFLAFSFLQADTPVFIDFTKVLNQSNAGKKAQDTLKKRVQTENSKYTNQEKKIREKEKELINKKKMITKDEYQKKVEALRTKIANLQKSRQDSFKKIAKSRQDARNQLLKTLNPIIEKYIKENNIRIVLDKKSILLGDTSLEIKDKIIEILNKELKSIKIN